MGRFITWLPFGTGIFLTAFVGLVLYTMGLQGRYGIQAFGGILAVVCFFGTLLGFSMQRMYEDFE